ncbi:putative mitochondrial protein [Sesamum angolense]|uniref:Mitochondrial protein n=1 Tax=Sesamum angolense TaxID=2727404 RepID=A0AAE1T8B0_9LAMI|nr:putative mitochondrial protein [Sesamum angolense]
MEEDIARLGQALILTEEEELGVVMPAGIWHSDSDSGGFHTVGQVLSHKSYYMQALKTVLQSALNPAKGMTISFIANDRFLLKFFHSVDRDRVLDSGPWAFEKNLIVLAKLAEIDNPRQWTSTGVISMFGSMGYPLDTYRNGVSPVVSLTLLIREILRHTGLGCVLTLVLPPEPDSPRLTISMLSRRHSDLDLPFERDLRSRLMLSLPEVVRFLPPSIQTIHQPGPIPLGTLSPSLPPQPSPSNLTTPLHSSHSTPRPSEPSPNPAVPLYPLRCEDIITKAWARPGSLGEKLECLGARHSVWGRLVNRETKDRIARLEQDLVGLKGEALTSANHTRALRDREELTKLIIQEEFFWKQRTSKTIANRLKPWSDRIISPSQSAFVSGRLITDNVLLAFETNHFLHTHSKGLKHFMNLKLDISKAYDRVEWSFLRTVLVWLHFPSEKSSSRRPSIPLSVSTLYRVPELAISSSSEEGYDSRCGVAFRSKKALFPALKDHIWRRIQGWHEKTLSQAGKAVLIQAVVQAIPSYAMSYFRLPRTLLQEFQALSANFFWNDGDQRKIHWIAWNQLCFRKLEGGLGFRNLEAFNLALLGKQLRHLLSRLESLVSKVLKAKYYPRIHLFEAQIGTRPSYTWRSLFAAFELLKAGC